MKNLKKLLLALSLLSVSAFGNQTILNVQNDTDETFVIRLFGFSYPLAPIINPMFNEVASHSKIQIIVDIKCDGKFCTDNFGFYIFNKSHLKAAIATQLDFVPFVNWAFKYDQAGFKSYYCPSEGPNRYLPYNYACTDTDLIITNKDIKK
jgi:hypothetical protein